MIWSLYVPLRPSPKKGMENAVYFEEEAWNKIVDCAVENGINQIVMEINNGLHFASAPELAMGGAWTRQKARTETKRLAKLGIELIPLMNFSATHHQWLGEYSRMMSTKEYYRICRELISEVYDVFCHPRYIHIGMDEEGDSQFFGEMEYVNFRQGDLYFHDLQFLLDCVRDTGATPWIWADPCMYQPEEFRKRIGNDDIVIQPWIYYSIKKEHYTKTEGRQHYIDIGRDYGVEYVEEAPIWQIFTRESIIAAKDGFKSVPCASTCFWNTYCHDELVEYFKENAPAESVLGFMTAPWVYTREEDVEAVCDSIRVLAAARRKHYGN